MRPRVAAKDLNVSACVFREDIFAPSSRAVSRASHGGALGTLIGDRFAKGMYLGNMNDRELHSALISWLGTAAHYQTQYEYYDHSYAMRASLYSAIARIAEIRAEIKARKLLGAYSG